MKMLFFSSDETEVDQISRALQDAGIPCEVRPGIPASGDPPDAEIWVRNDRDCHRALLLCVQLGIGFARRPAEVLEVD